MTDPLTEAVARALAKSHGLDFDEVCGVDATPDDGYCDSGTCIASGYEDHDAAYARACYLSDAQAAIAALQPAIDAAWEEGRKAGLDEAARECDEHARLAWSIGDREGENSTCSSGRNYGARACAQAIRAKGGDHASEV